MAGELHYFGVHQGSIGFGVGECDRICGWGIEEEVLKNWSNRPKGSIAKGINIMFLARILPMTLSPMVEVPVVVFFCYCVRVSFVRVSGDVSRHWPIKCW
jgi:hypothetical protein